MKKIPVPQLIPVELIERHIHVVRDQKVMLDSDLAELYGVETRAVNQAVKRNMERFPQDFMFQLRGMEVRQLVRTRLESGIDRGLPSAAPGRGGVRALPYAFTEQGVAMLSSVLHSPRAAAVNVEIMRAFVRMRRMMISSKEMSKRLDELETQVARKFETYDQAIAGVFRTLRELMNPPLPPPRKFMGFVELEEKKK